ncbi:MAG: rhomboid family intramembrane serine protease [Lentimicrobiaceae bacterium]|nr:rhomboid family intramembrane serine protease [Lentimicrobiaceae bacterium]
MQSTQETKSILPIQKETSKEFEKKFFFQAILKAIIIVTILWVVFLINDMFGLHWNEYGLVPRKINGLFGIITMHFLHGDYAHLFSNSVPLLVLLFSIFYFFHPKALLILLMSLFIVGILTWIIGTDGIHIGASGIVYALAFFLVIISILKQETKLMAYSLIIIFLYGSIVWGFFPQLFPDKHISWEGHLAGAIAGIVLAFFYKDEGPEKKVYFEDEEENEIERLEDEMI